MDRDIDRHLVAWKKQANRKPLVLRGARQVGKTTVLKKLGQNEFEQVIYLNFEEDPRLASLFAAKLEPKSILMNISLYYQQKINPGSTLLIFDEIQECEDALNSLKYFCEQAPQYAVAAAGSLLGVKLAKNKGFPVGKVQFMDLYPLSFFEFLQALKREDLRDFLEKIDRTSSITELIHDELINLLKRYFFVGGMPEAVANFAEHQDFQQVRSLQKNILDAYLLDFAKHATAHEIIRINQVWDSIPSQLAKENKKFIFSAIASSARAREYEAAIQWLADAGLIYKSYLANTIKLPLTSYCDKNSFKVFLVDIGLLGAMTDLSSSTIISSNHLFTEFKGALTENFVAQSLIAKAPHKLYYWNSSGTAEIDFISAYEDNIYPLEVKAGNSKKHKSLTVYLEKNPTTPVLSRANSLNYSISKQKHFINYPLYLISQFPELSAKVAI